MLHNPIYPDHYVTIKGVKTRYWTYGRGPKTIVLVHGYTGSVLEWVDNIPELGKKNKVIALDLPGHGRTDKPDASYTYEYFCAFLHDFFIELKITNACLVGHSMGGAVSLLFAVKYPEKVSSLCEVSPAFGTKWPLLLRMLTLPLIGELLLRAPASTAELQKEFGALTYTYYEYNDIQLNSYYEFRHSPGYQRAMLRYLRATLNIFGLNAAGKKLIRYCSKEYPRLFQPVLLVWGKQDAIIPFKASRELRKLLKHVSVWEPDQCGHCAHFEYADEFNRRVLDFLAGI
ncbi:MAG: alpha/beta hydrolase [Spirochaetales bacterium]|nr:alpha/beta hydrolase [Spirochaetales bacterium]